MVADPPDGDPCRADSLSPGAAAGAVAAIDPVLLAALDHRVLSDDIAAGSCWTSTTLLVRSGTL
jgi:hypothetical protein